MKKVYIYESHLGGGFYTSSEPLDYEDLYCETCGDTDTELGGFESLKDVYYRSNTSSLWKTYTHLRKTLHIPTTQR